jgi:hypothetical protein
MAAHPGVERVAPYMVSVGMNRKRAGAVIPAGINRAAGI